MVSPLSLLKSVTSDYQSAHSDLPDTALHTARFIKEVIYPLGACYAEDDGEYWLYLGSQTNLLPRDWENPPVLGGAPNPFDPNGKILVLYEKHNLKTDGDVSYSYEYVLQSALPLQNIPETPEEADYILRVKVEWVHTGKNNNIDLYRADTTVTLYDAKTSAFLMDVCQQSDHLEGFTMVMGNSYHQSVRFGRLLPKIIEKLFP